MVDPMSVNYNLTALASVSAIDQPADWLSLWNGSLNGIGIFVLLGVVGLILFLAVRKFVDSDTEALTYASFVVTVAGLFLFLVETSAGEKLLGWGYYVIILLITAISSYLNFSNTKF